MSGIYGMVIGLGLAVFLIALYAWEDHDKRKRRRDGLPPKKYGDITDYNTIDIVVHTRDD